MAHKTSIELVLDCGTPRALAGFWSEALGYRRHYADEAIVVLVPRTGTAPPLILQGVPEPKVGKNHMHLDIVEDDLPAEVQRLEALGARRIDEDVQSLGGTRWVRMSDPEGNEFCVSSGVEW